MHKKVIQYTALTMAMIASGQNPFFDIPRPLTERQRKERERYLRERAHRLNPVDMSEREFIINGERIMAHDKKTARKIYKNRHRK